MWLFEGRKKYELENKLCQSFIVFEKFVSDSWFLFSRASLSVDGNKFPIDFVSNLVHALSQKLFFTKFREKLFNNTDEMWFISKITQINYWISTWLNLLGI